MGVTCEMWCEVISEHAEGSGEAKPGERGQPTDNRSRLHGHLATLAEQPPVEM
jgi:hypothetical protein